MALVTIMLNNTTLAQINLDGTKTIDADKYYQIPITGVKAGDILNVNIQVIEGGPVDVLLMKSSDYVTYLNAIQQNRYSNYILEASSNIVKSKTYSYTFPESGDYYLVIDNTLNPGGGAEPTGAVDAKITVISSTPGATTTPIKTPAPKIQVFEAILSVFIIGALVFWRNKLNFWA